MPTYIIKPSRDEDFYVWWSTVVDAPIGWGPRDYVPLDNEGSPERFARADERGTSANWPDWGVHDGGPPDVEVLVSAGLDDVGRHHCSPVSSVNSSAQFGGSISIT